MNPTADPDDLRYDAISVVKEIAASTGFDTIAKISTNDHVVSASVMSFVPRDTSPSDYETLLQIMTNVERDYPDPESTAFACALILPVRDIAYLHDSSTNPAADVTLFVGPNPNDESEIRDAARTGLSSWMSAIRATQRTQRPVGHAFPKTPRISADRPPTRPQQNHLNPPRLNGHDPKGPYR